jgi:hypothetical protein
MRAAYDDRNEVGRACHKDKLRPDSSRRRIGAPNAEISDLRVESVNPAGGSPFLLGLFASEWPGSRTTRSDIVEQGSQLSDTGRCVLNRAFDQDRQPGLDPRAAAR